MNTLRVSFLLSLMIVAASLSAAQQYTVTDLGALGGNSSVGLALNNAGQVVGYSYINGSEYHAFVWSAVECAATEATEEESEIIEVGWATTEGIEEA
jgi:probable HAF family extracellular repeat protein